MLEASDRRGNSSRLRTLERWLWTAGVVCVTYCGVVLVGSILYQNWQSQEFDRQMTIRSEPIPNKSAPIPNKPEEGSRIGRLEIPRIGLSAMIFEGTDAGTLRLGVGHVSATALPGGVGNAVLAGHRDTFFRELREIERGDLIITTIPSGTHRYRVESIRIVEPSETTVMRSSNQRVLTLITCFPFSYVGPAPTRFVVQAPEVTGSVIQPSKGLVSRPPMIGFAGWVTGQFADRTRLAGTCPMTCGNRSGAC